MKKKLAKVKKFSKEMGKTLKNLEASSGNIMKQIEEADKKMDKEMKKVLESVKV